MAKVQKGGYVMVNAGGLRLYNSTAQTIPGIWKALREAIDSGRPVVLYNVFYQNLVPTAPIYVIATHATAATGECLIYTLNALISVSNADVCTKTLA